MAVIDDPSMPCRSLQAWFLICTHCFLHQNCVNWVYESIIAFNPAILTNSQHVLDSRVGHKSMMSEQSFPSLRIGPQYFSKKELEGVACSSMSATISPASYKSSSPTSWSPLLNDSTPRALAASFEEKLTACRVLSSVVRLS